MRLSHVALTALLLVPAAGAAAPERSATDRNAVEHLAQELFTFHLAHDMGFAAETLAVRAKWLTPELLALAKTYLARPGSADEAPVIDGDPFTNAQDTPTRFAVGTAVVEGERASVEVSESWEDGQKTAVVLRLRRQTAGWLVDDITYPDGTSFRQLLTQPE